MLIVTYRDDEAGAEACAAFRAGRDRARKKTPAGLTSPQMEVLALMTDGLANVEIAARLFISPKTVDHHVSAILAKLDARTRAEAVSVALQSGLLNQNSASSVTSKTI